MLQRKLTPYHTVQGRDLSNILQQFIQKLPKLSKTYLVYGIMPFGMLSSLMQLPFNLQSNALGEQLQPVAQVLPVTGNVSNTFEQVKIVGETLNAEQIAQEAKLEQERIRQNEAQKLIAAQRIAARVVMKTPSPAPSIQQATATVAPTPLANSASVSKENPDTGIKLNTENTLAAKTEERPATFIRPVAGSVSQPFTGYHSALDIQGAHGDEILAAQAGTVIAAEKTSVGYGIYVIIDHGNGYQTLYAHMSRLNVAAGQTIAQGAVVGNRGSTGRSTGSHLHFEIIKNGLKINPALFVL